MSAWTSDTGPDLRVQRMSGRGCALAPEGRAVAATELLDADDLGRLYQFKRDLVELRRAAAPLVEVCGYLLTDVFTDHLPDDIRPYFRDVHDHALRINEALDTIRETLALALQISLSLGAARQNEATKRLAGWGALLAIPTMVFSIYGMNFKGWFPELEWTYGYPIVMGSVTVACLLLYRNLKKSGWL